MMSKQRKTSLANARFSLPRRALRVVVVERQCCTPLLLFVTDTPRVD